MTMARTAQRDAPSRRSGRIGRFLVVSVTTIVAVLDRLYQTIVAVPGSSPPDRRRGPDRHDHHGTITTGAAVLIGTIDTAEFTPRIAARLAGDDVSADPCSA